MIQPQSAKHKVRIDRSISRFYTASCSCGWKEYALRMKQAETRALEHKKTVAPESELCDKH